MLPRNTIQAHGVHVEGLGTFSVFLLLSWVPVTCIITPNDLGWWHKLCLFLLQTERSGRLCWEVSYSSCGARASHCGGSSCWRTWTLGLGASVAVAPRPRSACSIAVAHELSCFVAYGIFLGPGIKLVSLALTGQFLSTVPWEKSTRLWVQFLGLEDPLEEEMAMYSSILAWRSHGQDRPSWATVHRMAKNQIRLRD